MKRAFMASLAVCCILYFHAQLNSASGKSSLGVFLDGAASPATDLKSPSPTVRAAAAAKLRASYTPPPQAKWDALLAKLKVGDPCTNVEAILKANAIGDGSGEGGAGYSHYTYRLDDAWVLKCDYRWGSRGLWNETLHARSIQLQPIYINLAAPTNFTGVWILYYVNGQKCLETNIKNGVQCGDNISYRDDGTKLVLKHHEPGRPEIEYTQYYHSGKVMTRGTVDQRDRHIGTWTNYSEVDGSVMDLYPGWPQPPPH